MVVLTALVVASTLRLAPVAAMLPKRIEAVIQMDFSVPQETEGWYGRSDNEEAWSKMWDRFHKGIHDGGNQSLPELNFKKYTVIGICSPLPTAGVRLTEVVETNDAIYVRYRRGGIQWRPEPFDDEESRNRQEAMFKRMKESYRMRLAFIVIPKVEKKVVIQVNVSGLIRPPYVWEDEAELPLQK